MANTCDNCMYLSAKYAEQMQCLQSRPDFAYDPVGMGSFPGVDLTWWCGQWAAWAPLALLVNAGDGQTVTVGQLAPVAPSVIILDDSGRGVYGEEVTFAVTAGGGIITGAVATTDRDGIATVGSWTMGDVAGANALSATAGALGPIAINATGEALIMSLNGGDAQVAVAGSVLPIAPSVLVTDQALNPLEGVFVFFAVTGGGGSVQDGGAFTDVNGIAAPTSWTLGAVPGPNTLDATSPIVTADGDPVSFTATGT